MNGRCYRYGEVRTASFTLIVHSNSSSYPDSAPSSSSTLDPSFYFLPEDAEDDDAAAPLPPTEVSTDAAGVLAEEEGPNATEALWHFPSTPLPIEKTEEYKKQFFLVKVGG